MNIVDYVILGILGVSVLFGFYRGFIASVLNTGGCLISVVGSFMLYPKLTEYIANNPELQRTLLTYTDASSRIGDLATSIMNVGSMTAQSSDSLVVFLCCLPSYRKGITTLILPAVPPHAAITRFRS